jgi:tetratricopeptide (TPR) repeat protein
MSRPDKDIERLSMTARQAVRARDWSTVVACANGIIKKQKKHPEGYFLAGLFEKATGRQEMAAKKFSQALSFDANRYDAAIELANVYASSLRHGDALELLRKYQSHLSNSPLYLNMAADTWSRLGLHEPAYSLYRKANELQPDVEIFQAKLASCASYLGKIEEAKNLYLALLEKHPNHQKNHFELSRLGRAKDDTHLKQMKSVLDRNRLPPEKNVFLYYAIGKELEDLERWDEAFEFYKLAGDTVTSIGHYNVDSDIEIIDKIMTVCDKNWLSSEVATKPSTGFGGQGVVPGNRTPVFIVGLPRTGTTLTDRIISSHSQVESADESFFLQLAIREVSGIDTRHSMSPGIVEAAAEKSMQDIANAYFKAIDYRLAGKPLFIEKLPENFLYLGFIARAFPEARMIQLRRHPMDACFALYKQSYFKFAYNLDDLAEYYLAYDRLRRHWQTVLGERVIELKYESLIADPDTQIRSLLSKLDLDFEQACLNFDQNQTASGTASAVQVREKIHLRSLNKWKKFASHLTPLMEKLKKGGIELD